jgi:hypothetical protein
MQTALAGLQWTLGLVILIEAVLFVMPSAAHDFAKTHMPDIVRLVLGWGEIIGSLLLLIPRTVVRGGWYCLSLKLIAFAKQLLCEPETSVARQIPKQHANCHHRDDECGTNSPSVKHVSHHSPCTVKNYEQECSGLFHNFAFY